jgi:hypothetical protein
VKGDNTMSILGITREDIEATTDQEIIESIHEILDNLFCNTVTSKDSCPSCGYKAWMCYKDDGNGYALPQRYIPLVDVASSFYIYSEKYKKIVRSPNLSSMFDICINCGCVVS